MIPEMNISSLNETQNLQEIISVLNETTSLALSSI